MRRVGCNISDEALEAVGGLPAGSTPALRRRSFDRFRMEIDAAAKLKLGMLPADFSGTLALSSQDLGAVPTALDVSPYGSLSGRA
jgi:hypothetical protein